MDTASDAVDGWYLACRIMDRPTSNEDDEPQRKSKRGPVVIFLIGWLCLPFLTFVLNELQTPWFQIGCAVMLAFIVVLIVAMVQVVRRF